MSSAAKRLIRKTDKKARVTLPVDFADCLVTLDRTGDVLQIRKARGMIARRYSFKQLLAGLSKDNLHPEVQTGPPVGRESL
jgi:hypothetical protein